MGDVTTRVLPADVYDALELSALAYGGIGQPEIHRGEAPCCLYGHLAEVSGTDSIWELRPEIDEALTRPELYGYVDGDTSDIAVRKINRSLGKPVESRVSFKQWCKELGVVRGAA
jgi:hypothetical protein